MPFTTDEAQTAASDILKAALSSGTIKLRGPGHDNNSNEFNLKLDGEYLNTLFTSLVTNIKSTSK